jgi:hypothetical protein
MMETANPSLGQKKPAAAAPGAIFDGTGRFMTYS